MSTIIRWEPFGGALSLRDAMNRLFEESVIVPTWASEAQGNFNNFALDMYETPNDVVVKAVLPGVKPDELDISITGDVLTIKAEMKPETVEHKEARWHTKEFRYGMYARSVTLPNQVNPDKVEATFANGILTLTMPKIEAVKPRTIKVKAVK